MEQRMSKNEFWKNVVSAKIKSGIKGAAWAAYFSAIITFVAAFFMDISMIADAFLALFLGLGIQFKKSRVCIIVLTVYFVISKIILLSYGFRPTNFITIIGFLIFYVNGIKCTFLYQKLWKSYLKDGTLPEIKEKIDMNKIHEFVTAQNQSQGTDISFQAERVDGGEN